jgi:lysophospholipid acyltransferase (LPLAT)-like uncharacterized protein
MSKLTFKENIKLNIISWLVFWLVRIWVGTVRVKILNRDIYDEYCLQQAGKHYKLVATAWHRDAIFLFYVFRRLEHVVGLISQSKDGELATRVVKRFGFSVVRGSSSRGGTESLSLLIQAMKAGNPGVKCGTPVDGPKGPARVAKKGMLAVAKETGAVVLPIACSGKRVITFSKAWDKTILPLPFSTIIVDFEAPFKIPLDATSEDMEKHRLHLEHVLNMLEDRVDRISGYSFVGK